MKIALTVSMLLYLCLEAGLCLLAYDSIKGLGKLLRSRKRLRKRLEEKREIGIVERADRLVKGATGREKGGKWFLTLTLIFALSAFLASRMYIGSFGVMSVSLMAGALPFVFLKIRLSERRNEASAEGESYIAELLTVYKLAGCRIDGALETIACGKEKKGIRLCRRLSEDVLSKIREAGSASELRACASEFAYAVGTKWAEMTAYAIGIAAADGTDISASLSDVMVQLREARTLAEQRRRLNGEAGRIVLLMVPISYVLTLFFSTSLLGVRMGTILRNQFHTTSGLMLFFAIIFLFAVNLLLLSLVRHVQFDY